VKKCVEICVVVFKQQFTIKHYYQTTPKFALNLDRYLKFRVQSIIKNIV